MVDLKEANKIVDKAEMELRRRMLEGNRDAANEARVKVEEAKDMLEKIKTQPVKKVSQPIKKVVMTTSKSDSGTTVKISKSN